MKKFYYQDGPERCRVCFSSLAKTPDEAMESITMETAGNCIGPSDFYDDFYSETLAMVKDNWSGAEEMSEEEAQERIEHLADEWGLPKEELEYLK